MNMSRNLQLLDISPEDLELRSRARLVAASVVLAFFSALIVIAPEGLNDPTLDAANVATASAGDANAVAAD